MIKRRTKLLGASAIVIGLWAPFAAQAHENDNTWLYVAGAVAAYAYLDDHGHYRHDHHYVHKHHARAWHKRKHAHRKWHRFHDRRDYRHTRYDGRHRYDERRDGRR